MHASRFRKLLLISSLISLIAVLSWLFNASNTLDVESLNPVVKNRYHNSKNRLSGTPNIAVSLTPNELEDPYEIALKWFNQLNSNTTAQKLTVPKFLFTFWNVKSNQDLPEIIRKTIGNWKRVAIGYDVMVLTHGSLPKVLELLSHTVPHNFHSIIPQFQADWVRLAILQGLGGIWVDASFIMDKSVDLLVDTQIQEKTHGFMFYLDGWTTNSKYKYFENWFIISTPRNDLITAWFKEFDYCFQVHSMSTSYLTYLKDTYGIIKYKELVQGNPMPHYLKQHMALQKVMQIDGIEPFSGIDACDYERGPLYLAALGDWQAERVSQYLIVNWPPADYEADYKKRTPTPLRKLNDFPPFVKLRNHERRWLEVYSAAPNYNIRNSFRSNIDAVWLVTSIFRLLRYSVFGVPIPGGELGKTSLYCTLISKCL